MGDYVAVAQVNDSLYHHGVKGQQWGVRRYQNSDGSLTEEGRRRYGRNGGIMSINTKERLKQGAKIGVKVGAGVGALGTALSVGSFAAAGVALPPAAIAVIGGTYLASYATTGALRGALVGGIYGAVETHQVRQFMRNEDNMNIKIKDLK